MKATSVHRIARLYSYVLLAVALLYLAVYVTIALLRMPYPFELEWMEGGSLQQVRRMLAGQRLYVAPSLEYVPYIYPPLYFYVAAAVAKFVGVGFFALRLVSFLASLASLFLVFLVVRSETGNHLAAALASGLFAATFRLSGAWFDIARVDSLFLLLLLAALYTIRFHTSAQSHALAGALIALAILTKQTALIICLPLVLYCVKVNWRRSLVLILTAAAVAGLATFFLNRSYGGWLRFFVIDLPSRHRMVKAMLFDYWLYDLVGPLGIAGVIAVFYFLTQCLSPARKEVLFYFLASLGMIGGAWAARLNDGGYSNALLPACAILAILFGLGTHHILATIKALTYDERKPLLEIFVYLICLAQFALLIYKPLDQLPTQRDRQAGERLVATIQQIPGQVLIPCHGYLATLAGKDDNAHWIAAAELLGGFGGTTTEVGRQWESDMRQALQEKRFAAIILDSSDWLSYKDDIERFYAPKGVLFDDDSFWPVTGSVVRPYWVYLPREP